MIRDVLKAKPTREDLELRLREVDSAIANNHPNAARFHFERQLIRRLLNGELLGDDDEPDPTVS